MADLQKLPIQAKEVIGADVYAVPTVTERVPSGRTMFDPYRILTVSGEKQQDVQVRVNGLDNSFVPNKLTKVILKRLTPFNVRLRRFHFSYKSAVRFCCVFYWRLLICNRIFIRWMRRFRI